MSDPKAFSTVFGTFLWQGSAPSAPSLNSSTLFIDNTGVIYAKQSDNEDQEIFRGGTHVNSKGQFNGLISNMPANNDYALDLKASASPSVSVLRVKNSSNVSQFEVTHQGKILASSLGLGATGTLAGTLDILQGTLTANLPSINRTSTWNNVSEFFIDDDGDITDSTSDASSLIIRRRINGVNVFTLAKTGLVTLGVNGGLKLNASGGGSITIKPNSGTTTTTTFYTPLDYPAVNGYVLSGNTDGTTAWIAPGGGGGGGALSALTAATATNTINNTNFGQEWKWDTLAGGYGLYFSAATTLAASNTQKLLYAALSGANATGTQTTHTAYFLNTHTGTSSTNIALYASATGGTTNWSAYLVGDSYIATAAIRNISSTACFGYNTATSLGNIAIRANSGFDTIINAATGKAIYHRINDSTELMTMTASLITIAPTVAITDSATGLKVGSQSQISGVSGGATFGYQGMSSANFALHQNGAFDTVINGGTGRTVFFRINNTTDVITYTSSLINSKILHQFDAAINLSGATSSFPSIRRSGTQLQVTLADNSAFAPIACSAITSTQGTLTASTPFINHTSTWNSVGVTFVNLISNVTDSASATASQLLALQVNAANKFRILKNGDTYLDGGNLFVQGHAIYLDSGNPTFWSFSRSGNNTQFTMQPNASSYWVFAESSGGTNWFNVRADAQAVGIGIGSPTSFLHINQISDSTKNTTPVAFNCASPGATGELTASSGTQVFAQFLTTINQSGTAGFTVLKVAANTTVVGSGETLLIDAHHDAASVFKVSSTGDVTTVSNFILPSTGRLEISSRSWISSSNSGRIVLSNSVPDNFDTLVFGVDGSDSFPGIKVSADFIGFDLRTTDDGEYASLKGLHLYASSSIEGKTLVGGITNGGDLTGTTGIVLQSNNIYYRLTGNVTLNGITSGTAGATYTIIIKQDATGGRTINWGSYVQWSGGTAPVVTSGANKASIIYLIVNPDGTGNIYGRYDLDYL